MTRGTALRLARPAAATVAMLGAIFAAAVTFMPPAFAVDDLPVVEGIEMPPMPQFEDEAPPRPVIRPYAEPAYRPGPHAPGPYVAIPSERYERPGMDERPMLAASQVVRILRRGGYSPLGQITQRGWVYTVAALDPDGDDGRLIIDARTGRIMRFIPAMAMDPRFNDRMAMMYGPPGSPPAPMARPSLRPPAPVPHVAARPAPKIASRMPATAPVPAEKPAAPAVVAPSQPTAATPATPEAHPGQTSETKSAEVKPAQTIGVSPAPALAPAAAAAQIQPTQAMPPVQGLD